MSTRFYPQNETYEALDAATLEVTRPNGAVSVSVKCNSAFTLGYPTGDTSEVYVANTYVNVPCGIMTGFTITGSGANLDDVYLVWTIQG